MNQELKTQIDLEMVFENIKALNHKFYKREKRDRIKREKRDRIIHNNRLLI